MRRIGIVWPNFERDDCTRNYNHEMRSVYAAVSLPCTWRYILARFNRQHILCDRSLPRADTAKKKASMSWVGKSSGNTFPKAGQKCCLSECPINIQQCSINFLVPLSVTAHIVSKVLCFQFCRRTVPEERAQQSMSTLFRWFDGFCDACVTVVGHCYQTTKK